MDLEGELALLRDADARAANYLRSVADRRAFPVAEAIESLEALGGPLPEAPTDPRETLALLDDVGAPGAVTSPDRVTARISRRTRPGALTSIV